MARSGIPFKPGPRPWLRGKAEIDDGVVMLDEDQAEQSWLWINDDALALDLANIRDAGGIPGFVARYGLLRSGPGAGPLTEDVSEWLDVAQGVRVMLEAVANLKIARDIDHDRRLEAIDWIRDAAGEIVPDETPVDYDRARELIARWVGSRVTAAIQTVQVSIVPLSDYEDSSAEPGEYAFAALPDDLIGVAYWQVATMLSSQTELKRCAGCQRMFIPRQQTQRFHDPSCGNRARQRRYHARHRGDTG